jgi:hypothetical protein
MSAFLSARCAHLPFLTLGDSADAIPWLQADPSYRARMAAAGHGWASR